MGGNTLSALIKRVWACKCYRRLITKGRKEAEKGGDLHRRSNFRGRQRESQSNWTGSGRHGY